MARRLWDKQAFRGANEPELVAEEKQWRKRKEEYRDLIKVGRWLIPTHVRLTDKDERVENYHIKKVEFWSKPDTNWFEQVMEKYAARNPDLRLKDLDEPGVAPGKGKPR